MSIDSYNSTGASRAALVGAVLLALLAVASPTARAAEKSIFTAGRSGEAELRTIGGLPVLSIVGGPEEMGRQQAALVGPIARPLVGFPKQLIETIRGRDTWDKCVEQGMALVPQFPPDHLAELDAMAKAAGIDRPTLVGVNTMVDVYRGGFGCSSLIVPPDRSAAGGALLGRNLDFFTLGMLQRYSLVVVYRPEDKHAFAAITFPGFVGCLSGMNDAGLAVVVHESGTRRDGSPMFRPGGTPYALAVRRILEECITVEEAEKLLRSMKRTTQLNLAVCDRRGGGVLEMTPNTVVLRREPGGVCPCTNHFRSPQLRGSMRCDRYDKLMKATKLGKIGLDDLARSLDDVNQGRATLQTMIFEPGPLRLHLAIGSCPSSALPLKPLELAPLFGVEGVESDKSEAVETFQR